MKTSKRQRGLYTITPHEPESPAAPVERTEAVKQFLQEQGRPLPHQMLDFMTNMEREWMAGLEAICKAPPPWMIVDAGKWTELVDEIHLVMSGLHETLQAAGEQYVATRAKGLAGLAELVVNARTNGLEKLVLKGEDRIQHENDMRHKPKRREPFVELAQAALKKLGQDTKPRTVKKWLEDEGFLDRREAGDPKVKCPAGDKAYKPIAIRTFTDTYIPLARTAPSSPRTTDSSRKKTRKN